MTYLCKSKQESKKTSLHGIGHWLLFLSLTLMAQLAQASLGGGEASIERDRVSLGGTKTSYSASQYTVHEIKTGATSIKEFISTSGVVFAASWRGLSKPDLAAVFGSYYQEYLTAAQAPRPPGRAPLVHQSARMMVREGGHMRDVRGLAYIPTLLPPGVHPQELQ